MEPDKKGRRQARPETLAKEDILQFLQSSPGNVGRREIARAFGVRGAGRIDLKRILKELAADGLIEDTRRRVGKGALPQIGVIVIRNQDEHGDLTGTPLHWNDEDGTPPRILLDLTRNYQGPAMGIGDHVLARLREAASETSEDAGTISFVATPIKRLPRDKPRQLGILRKAGRGFIVESIDKKDLKDWPVQDGDMDGAEEGELVRFETVRDGRLGRPAARVTARIGHPQAEKAVSLIAVHNHGLRDQFGADVLRELETLPGLTMAHREDLTRIPLVTIDPEDAKDHDDAVWAAPDPDPANPGGAAVIVAIADVSFYVRPGSALDREASLRGNSVYFPDRVVPMLPEKLSNDLCSLRGGELRPCLAVRMTFDRNGVKLSHRFLRAMMRSAAKLSYQEAQAAIDGKPNVKTAPLAGILKPLWQVYTMLKEARDKRAPLDLDLPERKIILDARGLVSRVIVPERLEAHRLIEEFMIQANVAAAEALEAQKSPLIYRVHDAPSSEKLVALSEFLASIGISAPKSGFNRPGQFNRILAKAIGTEHEELLNEVVLRSQAQAEYRAGNLGHFGLNLRRYAHFTSPIRRYADLVVHRALVSAFGLGDGGLSDAERSKLGRIAETISQSERKAMSAERETVERLIALHLAERVGEAFQGRISGVTRSGLFVKLDDTGADGFVPARALGRDYYRHIESAHALVGERTGESFRLGDKVDVRLAEVNPAAGALRFEMLSDGRFSAGLAKAGRKHGAKSKNKAAKASVKRVKQSLKNKRGRSSESGRRAE